MTEVDTIIAENDAVVGICNVEHTNSDYEFYMNLTTKDIVNMSKQDCIIAQYSLTRYAIAVNKKLSIYKSQYAINRVIFTRALAKVYSSYDKFLGNELITASASNEYDYIKEMQDELLKIDTLIKSMEGLVERIDRLVMTFKDLSFTKGRI